MLKLSTGYERTILGLFSVNLCSEQHMYRVHTGMTGCDPSFPTNAVTEIRELELLLLPGSDKNPTKLYSTVRKDRDTHDGAQCDTAQLALCTVLYFVKFTPKSFPELRIFLLFHI